MGTHTRLALEPHKRKLGYPQDQDVGNYSPMVKSFLEYLKVSDMSPTPLKLRPRLP